MLRQVRYFVYILAAYFTLGVGHAQAGAGYDTTYAAGVYGSGGKTGDAGVFFGFYDTGSVRHIVHFGAMVDLGLTGPAPKRPVDGIFSLNYLTTYTTRADSYRRQLMPFVTIGYSRLFGAWKCRQLWNRHPLEVQPA